MSNTAVALATGDGPGTPVADIHEERDDRDGRPVRRSLRERGLTTVEYAVGIVLIIALVAVGVQAAKAGWFMTLVQELIGTIFRLVTSQFIG